MTERERLIELLNEAKFGVNKHTLADHLMSFSVEGIADHLLANGVIVPPCKVGDTVYIIDEADGYEEESDPYALGVEVLQLFVNKNGIALDLKLPLGMRLNTWAVVGKNVFLTKEDAEKALAERSEGK